MADKLIDKQVIFEGRKAKLELHHLESEEGRRYKREVIVHPGAVVVLPFVDAETILLIRSRRYVVGGYLLELPAGTLEKGENPMNCAGRELLEETGHLAARLQFVGKFFTSPGILSELMHAYAAFDLEKSNQALEEGEEIEVQPVSFKRAIEMIGEGEIADGKTIATLLMFERFYRKNQP